MAQVQLVEHSRSYDFQQGHCVCDAIVMQLEYSERSGRDGSKRGRDARQTFVAYVVIREVESADVQFDAAFCQQTGLLPEPLAELDRALVPIERRWALHC